LKFALWADRISTKKSIGTSPFHLAYGTDAVIPLQLGILVMKFIQEDAEETNDLQRRMFQFIHLSEERERVNQKALDFKEKMKVAFDKKVKKEVFHVNELVLRWDIRREEKAKHGKFNSIWFGLFKIAEVLENNAFVLKSLDGDEIFGGPVNGRFLKHFFTN